MEKVYEEYALWSKELLPENLSAEMAEIEGNSGEIYDRFCKDMSFGTSGIRSKMGVGTNRINEIVVNRVTLGVADYLLSKYEKPVVVIGYDTRINSKEYAGITAKQFANMGIDSYIFEQPTPVPVLSFAVRYLKATGGIMITASHNPKEYNGYKVYDGDGNQIDEEKARTIEEFIKKRAYFGNPDKNKTTGKIEICPRSVKEEYLKALHNHIVRWTEDKEQLEKALKNLSVVYTPLNGAGREYAQAVFKDLGVGEVRCVKEQWAYDGTFPTCPSPNPENESTFKLAKEKYTDEHIDIIIATDPDSDRMGVMAKKDGDFVRLTGDQAGILMLDYICQCHRAGIDGKHLQGQKTVYKSFASSPFAEDIAKFYGVSLVSVPTGFKNIALEMENLAAVGRQEDFLFGFEESLGYLYGDYTRDKDGILGVQLICLIAAYLKTKGMSLFDKLEELYKKHGYVESKAIAVEFNEEKDREKIANIMTRLFSGQLKTLMGQELVEDKSHGDSNMFKGILPQGHQIIVRPSGTELKVKTYIFARGLSREDAEKSLEGITNEIESFIETCKIM